MSNFTGQDLEPLYTLRAEDLSESDLERLTGEVPNDESVLRRLMGPGPKLLKGPRGSGKSNYLMRAYYRLRQRGNVIVAYINFSQHLALEPLMLRSERALEYFRQWLLYKIVIAIDESLGKESPRDLRRLAKQGEAFVKELQTTIGKSPKSIPPALSPSDLLELIERWCLELDRPRAVLLMDDAAHAFMQQQQREFFEIFRSLRSRTVACKAAIYPGVTSYSPFFNVGHEAEEIEVWIRPDSSDYLPAMRSIYRARFPRELQDSVRPDLVDMAAHAAFGLPRNFLNILSDSLGDPDDDDDASEGAVTAPTIPRLREAIRANADRVRAVFDEISKKLPRYENFVLVGAELQTAMVADIRDTNKRRSGNVPRYVGVAFSTPWDADLTQVFSLLEYAGVIRRIGTVSRGQEQYDKVQIHTSILIAENALYLGRNPSAEGINAALARQSADDFVRRQPSRLFTADRANRCQLNLSPCPKCGSPRVSDDAVFCFKCGTALTEQSVYEEVLRSPIERLGLTQVKQTRILEQTNLRTVQDVLLDDGGAKLRTVRSVGTTWSARIKARAEEYVTL